MNRTLRVYGPILGSVEEIRNKYKSDTESWKDFYKNLYMITGGRIEKWLKIDILNPDFIKELHRYGKAIMWFQRYKDRIIATKIKFLFYA